MGRVKRPFAEICVEPEGPFYESRRRIAGYLAGCFTRGAKFKIWDAEQFARATFKRNRPGLHPVSTKHVQRVWPIFRKMSGNFRFEQVRLGRSFRWRVEPVGAAARSSGRTGDEIARRLVGYIRGAADRDGRVNVNEAFLMSFYRRTRIPPPMARATLPKIKRIAGLKVSVRTFEQKIILKVSLPHFPRGGSSPTGRNEIETTERPAAAGPGQNSGLLRSQHGALRAQAFAVSGRWVSGRRLWRLACTLAHGPLKSAHDPYPLVRWLFPYASELARRMLKNGHTATAIIRAYQDGVRRSHADTADAAETVARLPSAAVAYAMRTLDDGRTPEARWAEFFATDPADQAARRGPPKPRAKPQRRNEIKIDPAGVNRAEDLHEPEPRQSVELRAAKLMEYLSGRGIHTKTFLAMPFAMRQSLLERAAALAGKNPATENPKPSG
jgi:hypothetical protein